MQRARFVATLAALTLVATACGATSSSTGVEGITITTTTNASSATTTPSVAAAESTFATTTAIPQPTVLDMTIEPSGWEDVTITTEDGISLYARFWPGNDVAVLAGHDFDNPAPGSSDQRPPQSSENVLPYSAAIAREGFTVLSIDFRGHGQSAGEYDVQASQQDLAAAYAWLEAKGYETIVMMGWVGSGTSAVVLDAARDDIEFDDIAMLFSPPQDTGLDSNRVIAEIEAPLLFIGSNAGPTASWSKRAEAKAANSHGVFIFERVPTGVTFLDVYGGELAGRMVDFLNAI